MFEAHFPTQAEGLRGSMENIIAALGEYLYLRYGAWFCVSEGELLVAPGAIINQETKDSMVRDSGEFLKQYLSEDFTVEYVGTDDDTNRNAAKLVVRIVRQTFIDNFVLTLAAPEIQIDA